MRDVLVIDDDEVSRELLLLFVGEAGYEGFVASSGDEALELLRERKAKPYAVLADMQMEGITGNALARALRGVCGDGTRMIAMSGSEVKAGATREFDGFVLKPMTMATLGAALEGASLNGLALNGLALRGEGIRGERIAGEIEVPAVDALSESTFLSLAKSMPAGELLKLYAMCLDDAERRIGLMRTAFADRDAAEYERAAHAIKGGCGMVGALELAELAGEMEKDGLVSEDGVSSLDGFLMACGRLRRMLDARLVQVTQVS